MSSFPGTVELAYGDEKNTSTAKTNALGTRGCTPDGRVFYYSLNSSVALVEHRVIQAQAGEGAAQHAIALTPSTAIGDWDSTAGNIPLGRTSIGVVWATAHTSGKFADGYMTVETTPGGGMYRILSDPLGGDSATATVIRLHPDDGIAVAALTTVSKLGFSENPYSSVIVAPATTLTGAVVGVAPANVPSSRYFWAQTYGPAAVRYSTLVAALAGRAILAGAAATAGEAIGSPISTATAATTVWLDTVSGPVFLANRPVIGWALRAIPDASDNLQVMLTIRA